MSASDKTNDKQAVNVYPQPTVEHDPRFTIGLLADVLDVIKRHGYPESATAADHSTLSMGLWRMLYRDGSQP